MHYTSGDHAEKYAVQSYCHEKMLRLILGALPIKFPIKLRGVKYLFFKRLFTTCTSLPVELLTNRNR